MSEPDIPAPRFVGDRTRAATIPLEWPIEFGGKVYDKLAVARLTAREVAEFAKEIAGRSDGEFIWPVLRDQDGQPIPPGFLDALDADDHDAISKAVLDFLPKRFRGAAKSASESPTGEPIA